jgi:hypothetical protein
MMPSLAYVNREPIRKAAPAPAVSPAQKAGAQAPRKIVPLAAPIPVTMRTPAGPIRSAGNLASPVGSTLRTGAAATANPKAAADLRHTPTPTTFSGATTPSAAYTAARAADMKVAVANDAHAAHLAHLAHLANTKATPIVSTVKSTAARTASTVLGYSSVAPQVGASGVTPKVDYPSGPISAPDQGGGAGGATSPITNGPSLGSTAMRALELAALAAVVILLLMYLRKHRKGKR